MKREWLLALASLVFLALIGGLAELAVRLFSKVDILGNSKELFVADAFGISHGNAPNARAVSFGRFVYTDAYGFRVPEGGVPGDDAKAEAILLLGDSVGFGAGVDEPQTFAGLLRARRPERRIYNSSTIAYAAGDYGNVVQAFVPDHPEVKAAVLVFCLNDVSLSSAQNIERHLGKLPEAPPPQNLTETLRSFRLLADANDYLRARSALYLFIRHRLLQTQTRDWKGLLTLYAKDADVDAAVDDVVRVAGFLRERGIPLVVVLPPFEYQLREPQDPDTEIPQRKLGERLTRAGVDFVDARPRFDAGVDSTDYFLGYDPMHFSEEGHRVMADVIADALAAKGF
jgi:lysophospholipase L1-like esterase